MSLTPFTIPLTPMDPNRSPMQIRSALNQIVQFVNGLGAFGTAVTTSGVSSGAAVTVLPVQTAITLAIVSGTSSTIRSFLDLVAWDPIHGTSPGVLASSSLGTSAADARTYTLSSGALQLKMAANTYTVMALPLVL